MDYFCKQFKTFIYTLMNLRANDVQISQKRFSAITVSVFWNPNRHMVKKGNNLLVHENSAQINSDKIKILSNNHYYC